MIIALDHIAIAVPELEAAIARFAEDFGLTLTHTEQVVAEKTATAFFPLPGTRIELISPIAPGEGAVASALEKRGPGLHHICFQTDDIVADMERLTAKGYQFINAEPRAGAHGNLVAFVHPRSTGGVLIELAQHVGDKA